MIEHALIGEVAAKLMDGLDEDGIEGRILEVGIVVVLENSDGEETTQVQASCARYHEQVGLFMTGLEAVREGTPTG